MWPRDSLHVLPQGPRESGHPERGCGPGGGRIQNLPSYQPLKGKGDRESKWLELFCSVCWLRRTYHNSCWIPLSGHERTSEVGPKQKI